MIFQYPWQVLSTEVIINIASLEMIAELLGFLSTPVATPGGVTRVHHRQAVIALHLEDLVTLNHHHKPPAESYFEQLH